MESEIQEQLRRMMEKLDGILESHPAAVYLPCFYRHEPPHIFLGKSVVRVMVRREMVFNPDGHSYDLRSRGFRECGRGPHVIAYEFEPGRSFELAIDGVLMEKQLGEGGLEEEVLELFLSLGVYDLVPLLYMRGAAGEGGKAVSLRIKKLDPDVSLPSYAHPGDAGLDIRSAEDLTLDPGRRAMVSTGFAMALPEGYAAFVQPRSGLAARNGISIVNTPGLIDCHYRGEVKVILVNLGEEAFQVKSGDRIAQMVIQRVEPVAVEVVEELGETTRGEGGFGSTGL